MKKFLWLLAVLFWPTVAAATGLVEETFRIPIAGGGALEAMSLRLDDGQRHPLALISHGAPREADKRPTMAPQGWYPQAREFVRRGWSAVIVMRRGYGESSGPYAESSGPCANPDYVRSGREGANDLRQTIAFAASKPYVDSTTVLAVGVSAGGLASVALAADAPPNLKAVISFAGGRGSQGDNDVCQPDRLVGAFRTFGASARVPMLWVYAANDLFFWPALARQFRDAFDQAGGRATLVETGPYGDDGHFLFSRPGIPIWAPLVDSFLAQQKLQLLARPIDLTLPNLAPPAAVSAKGKVGFDDYLAAAPHKAFAVGNNGAWSWRSGLRTADQVRAETLAACAKQANSPCRIYAIDNQLAK